MTSIFLQSRKSQNVLNFCSHLWENQLKYSWRCPRCCLATVQTKYEWRHTKEKSPSSNILEDRTVLLLTQFVVAQWRTLMFIHWALNVFVHRRVKNVYYWQNKTKLWCKWTKWGWTIQICRGRLNNKTPEQRERRLQIQREQRRRRRSHQETTEQR